MFDGDYIKERDVVAEGFVSRATLIRARHQGLRFFRIGAFVCYKPEDLEAWFCRPRTLKANAEGVEFSEVRAR